MMQFNNIFNESIQPPWKRGLTKTNEKRKKKKTYIFHSDNGYLKVNKQLVFVSAYSPNQSIAILKQKYSQFQYEDLEPVDYVKLLQQRKPIPSTSIPKQQLELNLEYPV
jgi:hypothetical protein